MNPDARKKLIICSIIIRVDLNNYLLLVIQDQVNFAWDLGYCHFLFYAILFAANLSPRYCVWGFRNYLFILVHSWLFKVILLCIYHFLFYVVYLGFFKITLFFA